jgi:CRP-like cAMP-binding protein
MDLGPYYFISEPITECLKAREVELLLRHSVQRKYPRGSIIFEEHSFPRGVYIIQKGRVKIFQRTLTGTDQIMNINVEGELIGYRPLLSSERYPVSASALETCSIIFIPKKDFLAVLEKSSSLSNTLLRFLSREFTIWVNTVSILTRTTVKERLLLNILILSIKYREKSKWPIRILLSKADLACLIGTSNETLARMLKVLKEEKLVSSKGRTLEIAGPDQLKKIEKAVLLLV